MNSVRVKMCGFTRVEDACTAMALGVDAIGLIFYSKSPRHVSIEQAKRIAAEATPYVTLVGLFVNAEANTVEEVLQSVPLQILQFHGQETEAYCDSFNFPYYKVLSAKSDVDYAKCIAGYPNAKGFLVDSYDPHLVGGTGKIFDWTAQWPSTTDNPQQRPLILAGGLTAENVGDAIHCTKPYAVDVGSGVEGDNPGTKNNDKMAAFMRAVRTVNFHAHA